MENPQMGMPAEMAPQGPSPEETAIYDQMRQQISPQEFSNEMLAGASQVDPQAVAEFTEELQSLDVSPEELDALNDLVDQILANPEQYDQLRQQYLAQGMPDDILPEQFDPYFFAALNMAVDQMIAAPTGVQAFAKGGIAELKPIAKAIASYGRNGDTMLAHITPAEARMLKRRGGSGTINPATGLPEFFLKKAFKSIGKAVKKFASSTVGRIVTTVALGFFLGPAAASLVGATSVAGVAAVSGFVGSAGSTLLAGGNLKDALKAGAIGGLTAGAGAGIMGGAGAFASGSASTAGLTPGQAFQGQVDKFTGAFTPGASVQAPVPEAGAPTAGLGPNQMPVPDAAPYSELKMTGTPVKPFPEFFGDQASAAAPAPMYDPATATRAVDYGYTPGGAGSTAAYKTPTIGESFSKIGEGMGMGEGPASFETFKQGASDLFSPGPTNAQVTARAQEIMRTTPGSTLKDAMAVASKELSPGILRTYGPAAVAGTGIMALSGGFDTKPVQGGDITNSLMKPVTQRIQEAGTQRERYMQGLPGVVYDDMGAPVYGQSTRLPTYDVPDYNSGGFGSFGGSGGQGIMNLPPVYTSPAGTIGSRNVAQLYNNADMYSNLVPRRYNEGGDVSKLPSNFNWEQYVAANPDLGRAGIDTKEEAQTHWLNQGLKENRVLTPEERTQRDASRAATLAEQKAARDAAAQQRAMRRSQGSGAMYANINAGLSALAPEQFPGAPVQLAADREAAMRGAFSQAKAVSDIDYARVMQQQGYRPEEVAALTGSSFGDINRRYQTALRQDAYAPMLQGQRFAMDQQAGVAASGQLPSDVSMYSGQDKAGLYRGLARQGMTDAQIRAAAENRYGMQTDSDWQGLQNAVANPTLYTQRPGTQQPPVNAGGPTTTMPITPPGGDMYSNITGPQPGYTGPNLYSQTLAAGLLPTGEDKMAAYQRLTQQGATDPQIRNAAETMFGPQSNTNWNALSGGAARLMNMGGIATLAQGGYPRRTGQISGPGTEKSDSIPAMLSDGEFVMTAKAVRGAGKGNRRAGAKQMYKLMHQLEKNSERG